MECHYLTFAVDKLTENALNAVPMKQASRSDIYAGIKEPFVLVRSESVWSLNIQGSIYVIFHFWDKILEKKYRKTRKQNISGTNGRLDSKIVILQFYDLPQFVFKDKSS